MELSTFAAHTPAKELNTSRPACRSFYDPHNTLQLISKQKSSNNSSSNVNNNKQCKGRKCSLARVSSADVYLQSAQQPMGKEVRRKHIRVEQSSKRQMARTQYIYCAQHINNSSNNTISNANRENDRNVAPITRSNALSETQQFFTPITPERKENTLFAHSLSVEEQSRLSSHGQDTSLNVTITESRCSSDSDDNSDDYYDDDSDENNNDSTVQSELQMNASYTPLNLEFTSNAPFRRNAVHLISLEPDVQEQENTTTIDNNNDDNDNVEYKCKTNVNIDFKSNVMTKNTSIENNNNKENEHITKEMYTPERCTNECALSHGFEELREEEDKKHPSQIEESKVDTNEEHAELSKESTKDQREHERCVMIAITPTQIRKQATESYRYKRCSALQCDLLENEQKRQWSTVSNNSAAAVDDHNDDDDDDDEWSECSESQQVLFQEEEEERKKEEQEIIKEHSEYNYNNDCESEHNANIMEVHNDNTSKAPCTQMDVYDMNEAKTSNKDSYFCSGVDYNITNNSRSQSASHARPSSTMREYTSHDDNENDDIDYDTFTFTDSQHYSHYNEPNQTVVDNNKRYYHYSKYNMSEEEAISIRYVNANQVKENYNDKEEIIDELSMPIDEHDVMSELLKRHVAFQQACLSEYCTRMFSALLTPFTFMLDTETLMESSSPTSTTCATMHTFDKDNTNDDEKEMHQREESVKHSEDDNDYSNKNNISMNKNETKMSKNTHVDISTLGVAPTPPSSPFNHSANAPRQMSIVSQLLLTDSNHNVNKTMLGECNDAYMCHLSSTKDTESEVCDSARHVLCLLFREHWNYECIKEKDIYNNTIINNECSSADIIADHMALMTSSEYTEDASCNMYEEWCDAYFAFYLSQYDNMIHHFFFDAMYFNMVARPALNMLEFAERRIICMQRDLYMHDRIELFMLLAHELLPTQLQAPRKEHAHKKNKGQLMKKQNKGKDNNPAKAMHVFSFFHSTAKSTYKPSSLMRTSAKLTKNNKSNNNNNNNKSNVSPSFEYTLHLKKKNLKTPRTKRCKHQRQEKEKRDSHSSFAGFLPALYIHKKKEAKSAESANYKDEVQSTSAASPVLHVSCEEGNVCTSTTNNTSSSSLESFVASHSQEYEHEHKDTLKHEATSPSSLSRSTAMQPVLRLGAAMNGKTNKTLPKNKKYIKNEELTLQEKENSGNRNKSHCVIANGDKDYDGENREHLFPMHSEEVQHITTQIEENILFSCSIRKSSHAASPLSSSNTLTKQDACELPSSPSLLPQIVRAVPLHSVEKVATRPRARTPPRPPVESEFACIANIPPREEHKATHIT